MRPHFDHLAPLAHGAQNRCFGCGEANTNGLQLEFLLAPDGTVVCPATIPDQFEGHPGFLHGGIIATLLDETMSKACRARGLTAMTRHMEVDFRRPVPSLKPIRMEGRIIRDEGRKHWVEATIFDDGGHALAHGSGLFVEVRANKDAVRED
jgi:uncharacterized protein (TIGR00369 family)